MKLEGRELFQQHLRRRLTAVRLRIWLHGLLGVVASGGATAWLAAWILGGLEQVSPGVKIGLSATWLTACLAALVALLVFPARRLRTPSDLCRQLERERSFANVLVAAEEACRRPERWDRAAWVSGELVRRLFRQAIGIAQTIRPGRLLAIPWAGRTLLGALAVSVLLAVALAPESGRLARGFGRLCRPWLDETYAPSSGLYLAQGPAALVAGSQAVLSARDFGTARQEVVCEVRTGSGLWREVLCTPDSGAVRRPYSVWRTELNDVRETFVYRFRRDGMVTDSLTVTVLHPPLLIKLAGRIIPPAYTGLAPQQLSRMPSFLEVLAGSQLEWTGQVNHPVSQAMVVTTAGDSIPLHIRQDRVSGFTRVDSTIAYTFHLRDEHGLENGSRLGFTAAATADLQPMAQLQRYDDDGKLPVSGLVVLFAEVADDFGLSSVDLLCQRESAGQAERYGADQNAADNWRRLTIWRDERGRGEVNPAPRDLTLATGFGTLEVTVTPADSTGSRLLLTWNLQVAAGNLDLVPGDVLALCLEAQDNRQPGPPGRGRSRVVRLVLPSAAEILTAQATEGQDRLDDLEEIRQRSQRLSDDLQRLDRELKKDPLPDWARQQEMEAALDRQRALQTELAELSQQLQEDLESLAENHLTSIELLEKMDQIAELLQQIQNEELEQLLAQLKEAVAKLSAEEIAEAMAEVAKNQQEMVQRLDRALKMLKELAREQELEGMTSLLAKLIREQQELLDANRPAEQAREQDAVADSLGGGDSRDQSEEASQEGESQPPEDQQAAPPQDEPSDEELANRQEALARELQQLIEQLTEALRNLNQEGSAGEDSPANAELQEALEEALEQLAQQKPSEAMQEAAEQLSQGNRSRATEQQEQALRDLGALYHVLIAGQEAMQMAMQQFEVTSLRRLAADLLALSEKEEEIADLIPNDLRDLRTGDLTRRQFRVLKAGRAVRDQLQSLSTSNPMQTMRILRELEGLLQELGRSVEALEAGRGALAKRSARNSLGTTNEIIINLLTQAHMQSGGSGSCPMPSMSEQLRQMAREQAGLNGLADQLRQQMQNRGLSQEMRAQMERLQADQQGLADSAHDIAELERGLQEGERLLGDLENLAAEMEKVVQDFDEGVIDDETVARQEKILSRLLDAHNSVRKRDFNSRRESRTAQQLFQPQQGQRLPSGDENRAPFQLRYQPVEKAPLEYRELVRRYFRAVEKWHQPDSRYQDTPPPAGGLP